MPLNFLNPETFIQWPNKESGQIWKVRYVPEIVFRAKSEKSRGNSDTFRAKSERVSANFKGFWGNSDTFQAKSKSFGQNPIDFVHEKLPSGVTERW